MEFADLLSGLLPILLLRVWVDDEAGHVAHVLNRLDHLIIDNYQCDYHDHYRQAKGEEVDEPPINHHGVLEDVLLGQMQIQIHTFAEIVERDQNGVKRIEATIAVLGLQG